MIERREFLSAIAGVATWVGSKVGFNSNERERMLTGHIKLASYGPAPKQLMYDEAGKQVMKDWHLSEGTVYTRVHYCPIWISEFKNEDETLGGFLTMCRGTIGKVYSDVGPKPKFEFDLCRFCWNGRPYWYPPHVSVPVFVSGNPWFISGRDEPALLLAIGDIIKRNTLRDVLVRTTRVPPRFDLY